MLDAALRGDIKKKTEAKTPYTRLAATRGAPCAAAVCVDQSEVYTSYRCDKIKRFQS